MIDSTFTYNGCKTVAHAEHSGQDEPSMCRHGLGTHETERSNMNRIVDMISIEMLTTETILNSKQELRNKRRLAKDEVTMRVGNGSKVDAIAVGTVSLLYHQD